MGLFSRIPRQTRLVPGNLANMEYVVKAHISKSCRLVIDITDLLVVLRDGIQTDDGTIWETGYAYAKDMFIDGIRMDFRSAEP
ncbi:hypothetical protein DSUL_20532 [Desulfovibrionales bacterium]